MVFGGLKNFACPLINGEGARGGEGGGGGVGVIFKACLKAPP